MTQAAAPLGWLGIARFGCVQAALGAIVVLTTSTLNRVMAVELALPAIVPGFLVALHYIAQVLRPRLGYGSDVGGRRTPWIIGGMALLSSGGIAAAAATVLMTTSLYLGIALAVAAFLAVGIGVGASGTSLLVLLAKRVAPKRRAPAATIVWLMMIAGIAITATVAGQQLEPFSQTRLLTVATVVAVAAFLMTLLAVWRIEGEPEAAPLPAKHTAQPGFFKALGEVWREGVRMGLWGAAQALAFGLGGLLGTGASDVARVIFGAPAVAYAAVFAAEAIVFLAAAYLAAGVFQAREAPGTGHPATANSMAADAAHAS